MLGAACTVAAQARHSGADLVQVQAPPRYLWLHSLHGAEGQAQLWSHIDTLPGYLSPWQRSRAGSCSWPYCHTTTQLTGCCRRSTPRAQAARRWCSPAAARRPTWSGRRSCGSSGVLGDLRKARGSTQVQPDSPTPTVPRPASAAASHGLTQPVHGGQHERHLIQAVTGGAAQGSTGGGTPAGTDRFWMLMEAQPPGWMPQVAFWDSYASYRQVSGPKLP